jgi:membrane associated rhomboid family serine protease
MFNNINLPPVVKNIIILNVLFFVATFIVGNMGIDLVSMLGVFHFNSPLFKPYQLITYMFMHGNLAHIFFNMFALFMFGSALEKVWGPKKFFIYYLITGFGAVIVNWGVSAYQVYNITGQFIIDVDTYPFTSQETLNAVTQIFATPTVGASGSVFGLLLAFGMLFPNTELMMLFFPIPIKAKYFVILYGALELFSGISNRPGDNVAHFAHLGGMLFGFFLIIYWKKQRSDFY